MKTFRYCVLLFLLISRPAFAEAPVYFDLGGLILYGALAIVLFVAMLVLAFRTKTLWVRTLCLLGLASYIAVPVYMNHAAHKVSPKGSGYMVFTNEWNQKSTNGYPILSELCRLHGQDQRPIGPIRGIRLLEARHLPDAPARGWDSGLSFFVGGDADGTPTTVVDALKFSMRKYRTKLRGKGIVDSPFLEYQAQDGKWMRYIARPGEDSFVDQEATETQATHGIRLMQFKTGLEQEQTIYGGSIEIINLSSKSVLHVGSVVGTYTSYTTDRMWGAHTNYALFPGTHCVGRNEGGFLTEWLEPPFTQ